MSFQTLEAVATRQSVVRVNLLPPEIEQDRRSRRLRLGLGAALLVVVGAAGAGYLLTLGHVSDAQTSLDAEQSRTAGLQAAQAPYAEVPAVYSELEQVQNVQKYVSGYDVAWYRYVDQIAAGAPTDTAFTSVVFAVDAPDQSGSAVVDPLAVTGIGTLSVNGQTKTQGEVASWLDSLLTVDGLADARLTNSTYDPQTGLVSFTTTATVTDDALLHRQ